MSWYEVIPREVRRYKYRVTEVRERNVGITGYRITHEFWELYEDGLLRLLPGYAWDGMSGWAKDTEDSMLGSGFHDALYQAMRLGLLPPSVRPQADAVFRVINKEQGMRWFRRGYTWAAVRLFGCAYNRRKYGDWNKAAAAAVLLLLLASGAAADTEITTSGQAINSPGERYYLTGDLNGTWTVSCTGCTLDGDGFTLNPANTDQITLQVTGSGAIVEDVTVRGESRESGTDCVWQDVRLIDVNNTDATLRVEDASSGAIIRRVGIEKVGGSQRGISIRAGAETPHFENCLIVGSTTGSLLYMDTTANGVEVRNCSIDARGSSGKAIEVGLTGSNTFTIYNSIVVGAGGRALTCPSGWTALTHANNDYVSASTTPVSYDGTGYGTGGTALTTFEPTCLNADPLWIGADQTLAGNYALGPTSTCIDAADATFAPSGTDYAGNTRTVGDDTDMGSEEDQGSAPEGACCVSTTCSVTDEESCAGAYFGDYSDCDPDPCSATTGACCDGTDCTIGNEYECTEVVGGTYQGDDTDCDPGPCACPPPGYILLDDPSDIGAGFSGLTTQKYAISGRVNYAGGGANVFATAANGTATGIDVIGCHGDLSDTLFIPAGNEPSRKAFEFYQGGYGHRIKDLVIVYEDIDHIAASIHCDNVTIDNVHIRGGAVYYESKLDDTHGDPLIQDSRMVSSSVICDGCDQYVVGITGPSVGSTGGGTGGTDNRRCNGLSGPFKFVDCYFRNNAVSDTGYQVFNVFCWETVDLDHCTIIGECVPGSGIADGMNLFKFQGGSMTADSSLFVSIANGETMDYPVVRGHSEPSTEAEQCSSAVFTECTFIANGAFPSRALRIDALHGEVNSCKLVQMGSGQALSLSEQGSTMVRSSVMIALGSGNAFDADAGWGYDDNGFGFPSDLDDVRYLELIGNTFYAPAGGTAVDLNYNETWPITAPVVMQNNVFNETGSGRLIDLGDTGWDLTSDNNLFRQSGTNYILWEGSSVANFAAWQGLGFDTNGADGAPDFVSATTDTATVDLHLGSLSAAIGLADADHWATGWPYDLELNARALTSGAFEESSGSPTGACCFANGSCTVTTSAACTGAGGTYEGDDTVCSPNPCPQPTGACCDTDGSCTITTSASCSGGGGAYQGDATTCSPSPCVGACCEDDGTCTVLNPSACVTLGGTWEGLGAVCSPNPCPQPDPTGACCAGDGSCAVTTSAGCLSGGGTYEGDDTVCSPNPCPQPDPTGACCAGDGSCTVETSADCSSSGGAYEGDDTVCSPNPCPQPTGACCAADGSCTITTSSSCSGGGGTYQGDGTTCSPNPCPAPPAEGEGACCDPSTFGCTIATPTDCATAGGIYRGNDTACSPDPCAIYGACCDETTCSITTQERCLADSDVWQGAGVDCSPNPCSVTPESGACCVTASCSVVSPSTCDGLGGYYQGAGTVCSPNPCSIYGACCYGSTCVLTRVTPCIASSGAFGGEGSDCDPNPCTVTTLTGACCTDFSCTITTHAGCSGGIYQGHHTVCSPDPCDDYGACCLRDGTCLLVRVTVCMAASGSYLGEGTDCVPAACP